MSQSMLTLHYLPHGNHALVYGLLAQDGTFRAEGACVLIVITVGPSNWEYNVQKD